MNIDLILKKVNLSWEDILWGYEHNYLNWQDIVNYAHNIVFSGNENEIIFKLSLIDKSSLFKLKPILEILASDIENYHPNKWLYLILYDIFQKKHEIKDPLGEVEKIYEDFNYPEEIESFVRYMPPNDGYIPSEHSYEENISRLYSNWEKYLNNQI